MTRPLRIAHVAPPFERVPPRAYGGTERIVYELVVDLDRRGYDITTFASGDSEVPGRHVVTVPEALRPLGYSGNSLRTCSRRCAACSTGRTSSTSSTRTSNGPA